MRWSTWRMLAAVVAASGVVAGLIVNIARALRMDEDLGLTLADYFGFFTITTAVAAVVIFVVAARSRELSTPDGLESRALAVALATVSAAVVILGVVYNALLRGLPAHLASPDPAIIAFFDRWSIETLHVVMPLYVVVDVLFGPRRRRLGWTALIAVVAYPLVWVLYTMIRGPFVPATDGSTRYWYPYPFLDPNGSTGYATPLIYIGAIAAGFLIVGAGLILLTRRRPRAARGIDAAAEPPLDATRPPRG